ncbi:K02A2.6-like, partial [Cordylochernes scorpioides]
MKDSEAKPKDEEMKDSEDQPKGDGVKDSEAKPKGDGVNDSEAKPKGDGVNDSEAKPKGDGVKDSTIESLIRTMGNQQRLMMDFLLRNKSGIRVGRPVKMDVATFDRRNADPKIWIKEQLATAGVECKQVLLKLLKNIRPISEKNYSESRPSARTLGTVEKPDHFAESSDTGLLQAANYRNVSFLSKKLTSMGSPVPWSESTIFSICDSPHSFIDVTINSHLVKAYLDSGSSLNLIHRNLVQKNRWKTYPTEILINTINHSKFTATEAINLVLEAGEQSIEIQAIVLPDMPFDLLIGKPTLKSLKVKWDFFTDQISFYSETGPNLVTRRDVEAKFPILCTRTFPMISKFEVDFGLQENFRVVSAKPYQLQNTKRNWLNMKIRSMLSEGIIKPSNSAFASPCIVIPKKNGDYRLCVDYRRINDETLLDHFPFPRIDDIINVFGGCRFFSKLDLKDGFWQLGISENTRKYTAFVTPSGHFAFLKLPFGWKNYPAKFQRIMTTILGELLNDKVVAYIDDICCGGYTQEDCSILTHKILERLNTAGLVLNLDKCQFCVPRIDLLGRVIDGDTKKIRSEVTEKVRNMKRPYNLRSLQCFTGLTNHFRAFIKDYAHIVRPLDKLKGKDVTFEWVSECETAYQKLIALITEEPILRVPDGRLPFELSTDASYYGTGAILYQRNLQEKRCKQLRVIGYYSYTFTKAEENYSVTEKECLAVLKAVKHFRSYLESRPFVVHADHRALTQLLSCGELRDRLARWQLFLRSFNIIINHRSGKELRDADALSRLCVSVPNKSDEQTFWLKHKALELKYDEQRKSYLVTPEQVPSILGLYHDDPKSGGHSGFWRTYYTIKNRFWWRNMKEDIRRYVQSCSTCQKVKARYRSTSDQMSLPVQSHVPFHTVHVDFAELKKKSESNASTQSFLVVIDEATRIVYAKCMKQSGKALKEYFTDHPILKNVKKIISDRGTSFTRGEFHNWTQEKGIRFLHTSPYHPAENGLAERVIQEIKTFMECYPQFPKGWKCCLEAAVNYHNRHHNTYLGFSPWYKWKGTVPIVPADEELGLQLLIIDTENDDKQRHKYRLRTKYYYNRNRRRPTDIKPGDSILVKHQYTGPILRVANKKYVETFGRCNIRITIKELEVRFNFVVLSECSHHMKLGWDFLQATNAIIDWGTGEMHLEECASQGIEDEDLAVYACEYCIIPGRSISKIAVISEKVQGAKDLIVEGHKYLLLKKELAIPSSVINFHHGRGDVWVTNATSRNQIIPAGYWQIEIDEGDRENTAFVTPDGLYEFRVMPFGLCNAPATFERMMDNLRAGIKWTICLCYLDDIIVYASSFQEHMERLEKVLKCIQRAGLGLNPEKCRFGSKIIKRMSKTKRIHGAPTWITGTIPPVARPFQKVGIDLLGRFPVSNNGNKWIVVATDYLSRYAMTRAIPNGSAEEVAKFMIEDVLLKHGAPRELISDRGRTFISRTLKEINDLCGIIHRFTSAYHPQTNGLTERLNKTLADMLSMYVDVEQRNWDAVLPYVTFAYNTSQQESSGFSPFYLIHGRDVETPLDTILAYRVNTGLEDYVE